MKSKILTGIFLVTSCLFNNVYCQDLKFPVVTPNDMNLVEKLNFGQGVQGNITVNQTKSTPIGTIITTNPKENNGWGFVLGPTGKPNTILRLNNVSPNGSIMFSCEKGEGKQQMALLVRGINKPVGTKIDLITTIGITTHTLPVEVTQNDTKNNISFLGTNGDAIPELLDAMAENDIPLMSNNLAIDDLKGHRAEFILPSKKDVAFNAANICREWKLDYEKKKQLNGYNKDLLSSTGIHINEKK